MRALVLFSVVATLGQAQNFARNQITIGGGWVHQISRYEGQTATALEGAYAYRVMRYFQVEAGLVTALRPSPQSCSAHGCYRPDDRYYWVPFGVRAVGPLWHDRVELSAGGGGTYEKYTVSNGTQLPCCFRNVDGWGGYIVGGAAVALDGGRHHWWLGASPKWFLVNPAENQHDRWFLIPLELSWRF